jgi:pimeloyl-ACP methyl ester carboxylesterase
MKKHFIWALLLCASCNQKPAQPTSGFIKAGNLQIYYERAGKGEPLLLIHAGMQDHTMWEEQVKTLSKQYDVITPDMPYHGKSSGFDTTIQVADVIKTLLDSLHIQKTSIGGLSLGGAVTLDFIIAYPQRVNKALLISSGIYGYDEKYPVDTVSEANFERFGKALDRKDTVEAAREFTRVWAESIYRPQDSLQTPVAQYVFRTTLAYLRNHGTKTWPRFQDKPKAFYNLSGIQLPVLIINGDKDLPIITATSQYLEKHIAGARHVVIKDAAHMLNMDKPTELDNLMLDFLNNK